MTVLLSVGLTRAMFDNESLTGSRIVGENVSGLFFNGTSLSVINSVPLSPGKYQFSLVLTITIENIPKFISSSAVLDILSPSMFYLCYRISVNYTDYVDR